MKLKSIKNYNVTPRSSGDDETQPEHDYITKTIGDFGVFQAIASVIVISSRYIMVANVINIVFLTPHTEFKCVSFTNDSKVTVDNSTCYNDCVQYEYYATVYEDAMFSRFDLICGRAWLASFMQTMTLMGVVLGVAVFGWISDRFGRRIAYRLAVVIGAIFLIATPFGPTFWTFTILRTLTGIGSGGVMALSTIFFIEIVGPRYKHLAGVIPHVMDGVNLMLLTAIAYYSHTCKDFLLYSGLFFIIHLIAVFTLPESPRWLIARHEGDQAIEVMMKIAKCNNRDTSHIKDIVNETIEKMKREHKEVKKRNFVDLFRTRKHTIITISSFCAWTTCGICFYGILQYSTFFGSNIYIVLPIISVFQIITTVPAIFITKTMKRKTSSVSILAVIGISMFILIFIPDGHWACVVFVTIGFIMANGIFCVEYVQVSELYPTPLRNMGFGLSSAGAKIGAMLAPFIANTEPHWVASTIFAVIPLIAIVFCLLLPETKGKNLQDTVD